MNIFNAIQGFFLKPFRFEPITDKDLQEITSVHAQGNEIWNFSCPCGGTMFRNKELTADGSVYQVGGEVQLANGQEYTASFLLNTAKAIGEQTEQVYIQVKENWFAIDDEELLGVLGLPKQEVFPIEIQRNQAMVR